MPIIYETEQQELSVKGEESLLEVCLKNNVPIDHVCEGGASCGTCRVIVTTHVDQLPERNELELEMAEDRGFQENERLACQLNPKNLSFKFKRPQDKKN